MSDVPCSASTNNKACGNKQRILLLMQDLRMEHLVAGLCGGVISNGVLHPLDLIKIRLQVNDGSSSRPKYNGALDCARQLFKSGGVKSFYQGVVPNVWGAGTSWGLYFFFYNNMKRYLQGGDEKMKLAPSQHMLAAAQSGVLTLSFTNPIWVAKTRMCLHYENSSGKKYPGMLRTLTSITKNEGVRGLYKGFVPGLFGVSHGAVQFMAYEEFKKIYVFKSDISIDARLSSSVYITCAAGSKMVAVITTYPYQVVRSRLQDEHRQYTGVCNVISQTYRMEGVIGFYKGLFPTLLRVTPACCLTFVIYETIITQLKSSS